MTAPHLLKAVLTAGVVSLVAECPGGDDRDCRTWTEVDDCQCRTQDLECSGCMPTPGAVDLHPEVDHDQCDNYDVTVDILGAPPCRTVPLDGCGLNGYPYPLVELIGAADWPTDFPIRVRVEWENGGEYAVLLPWKEPQ